MPLKYGGDYNPEQWPEEVWHEDVRLMREAGVNFVTVGVFSWSLLEPEEGVFEFGWLDRVLGLLHENGISVDLATATASPPAWLSATYPETLPVDRDSRRLWPGGRQHYCPSSPVYRRLAGRLAGRIAERYASHPAVTMWHINNEYGCHTSECYCDVSASAFRTWLRAKYETIDRLNTAWTTVFWSQTYSSFDQVLPPRATPVFVNPSQMLDYRRFSSTELFDCFMTEKRAVRAFSPEMPVTTNFIGLFRHVDYWKWVDEIDVISDDSYPNPLDPDAVVAAALSRDLMRSLGGGRPWLLMEQATGYVNWRSVNGTKPGRMMNSLSMQAVSRGADGVNFFQWRQSRGGAEKFHSGMLPHSGTATRTWRNVTALGADLARLADVEGATSRASVAFLLDWESWWAAEGEAHQIRLDFTANLLQWYRPFYEANVAVDFAHPGADLTSYRLAVAPHLYLYGDDTAHNIAAFVGGGGHLVASYFTGHVDENDQARLGGYLGDLAKVLGLSIDDFAALPATGQGSTVAVASDEWGRFGADEWSEYVRLEGAIVRAWFDEGDIAAHAAITSHEFGDGSAWYLATRPDPAALDRIVATIVDRAGVEPVVRGLPRGLEAARRGDYLFVTNQTNAPVEIAIAGFDVLTDRDVSGDRIAAYGAIVLDLGRDDDAEGRPAAEDRIETASAVTEVVS